MVLLAGMCMTCRKQLVCDEQNQKVRWHEHNGSQDCNDNTLFIYQTNELHDSPMFSAAVKKSGSRACVNPGVSAPIVSTPIVSTTVMPLAPLPRPQVTTSGALSASALRSAPIPGYIADGDTAKMSRPDKIRAVAQQAHDDGDCVCCLPDPDTITITISREDAVKVQGTSGACDTLDCGVGYCIFVRACLAALKGER